MDRIDTPGATPDGFFQEGNPFLGVLGTIVGAKWATLVQEEILSPIVAAGLTPSHNVRNQLLQAIQILSGQDVSTHGLAVAAGAGLGELSFGRGGEPRQAITLLRQSGNWPAGITPTAPTGGNTSIPNEYSGGVYPGNAWPFMTIGVLDFATGAGFGFYPAAIATSGVNYYRAGGFLLEGGLASNGAVLEITLAGTMSTTVTNRIVEIIVEPDFDPAAAFAPTKAFAFQVGAFSSSGGADVAFDCKVRIVCLGYDGNADLWRFAATLNFLAGNSPSSAPQGFVRAILVEVPGADVDFHEDQLFVIRFKTDDTGATLGNEGNTSGSDQTGAEITFTPQLAQVLYIPGEAA